MVSVGEAGVPVPTPPGRADLPAALMGTDVEIDADGVRRRELKHRLADAVREVVEHAHLVDATGTDVGELAELADEADRLARRLAAQPSISRHGRPMMGVPGWQSALTERSPISGRSNAVAAPLVLEAGGDLLRGHATYDRSYEGPPNCVHGGVIAGAFDEMVGVAQAVSGQAGMTGTLTVRMRRPTPIDTRIDYEAGVDRIDGRKIYVWAKSYADGVLIGDAEALMITPRFPLVG